jgi:branched-chain amino acid transport system ATP-binding protein
VSTLSVTGAHVGYAGSEVLHGVSLTVGAGEIVALLGANGAGKTTLMRAITGLIPMESGQLALDGADLGGVPAHERVARGLALAPEGRQIFPNLSVETCLLLGGYTPRVRKVRAEMLEQIYDMFPRLRERRRQKAGLMSGGEQQMLALGRALMSRPRFLLLDEPSLGLAPIIVRRVLASLQAIAAAGTGILLAEQNVHATLEVASRGYVLGTGRIVAAGGASELRGSDYVREAFLGVGGHAPHAASAHA